MQTSPINRAGIPIPWYWHECKRCKAKWTSPESNTDNMPCLWNEWMKGHGTCKHQGEPKLRKDGSKVKITCGCVDNRQFHDIHLCPIKKRCIPNMAMDGPGIKRWKRRKPESEVYQACQLCDSYEPKEE